MYIHIKKYTSVLIIAFALMLGLACTIHGAQPDKDDTPLPSVCIGFSGRGSYDIGLALYPNGDLWEIQEYGWSHSTLHDDPSLDTQNRIMTGVDSVTREYVLQQDGTLWAFGQSSDGSRELVKMMEQVQTVWEKSYTKLILKEDQSLWSWGMTEFSGDAATIPAPIKLADQVVAIHDDYVVELATGEHYLLRNSNQHELGLGYLMLSEQKLPRSFQALIGYTPRGSGLVVTTDAVYSADGTHLMDMEGIKQIDGVGGTTYILMENGDTWQSEYNRDTPLVMVLTGVEKLYSDYFLMLDGSYLDEYRKPLETIITPEMLEHALMNEDKLLLTEHHELYIMGPNFSRDIAQANLVDTDIKKAFHSGGWIDVIFMIKTDGTLWLHMHEQEEIGIDKSFQTKLAEGIADIIIDNETIFLIKENGSVWGVKPNKIDEREEDSIDAIFQSLVDLYQPMDARLAVQYGDLPVYLNGKRMTFDVAPFIEEGRTLVPVRVIAEDLGAEVLWNNGEVTVIGSDATIQLRIGSPTAFVNGEERTLEVSARIEDGRAFVPLRFIAEELSFDVQWKDGSVFLRAA